LSLRRHKTDHINNILHKYIKNNTNLLVRKSKKWHRDNIDYHIVTDFFNSINYHHRNHFAKTLDTKNKHILIRMHRSLGASLKQLTCFFDVQKNLSFSLENNMVKTYIHTNDHELISSKPLSPPPTTAFEFENNSPNQKNNYSTSGSSLKWKNYFMLNNSLFNSSAKLTSLKDNPTPFSSVFHHHESEQHLDSKNVFPPLPLLSTSFTHPSTKDSSGLDCDLEDLLLHLAYRSSSSLLSNLF
jgi:hypothetical protein